MSAMPMSGWASASQLAMWVAVMVAMMVPSLVPALWRYRLAFAAAGVRAPSSLAALVGACYLLTWSALSIAIIPFSAPLLALAYGSSTALGIVVTLAGALQLTPWKARHLSCDAVHMRECRTSQRATNAAVGMGVRFGLRCCCCCAGFTMILLASGDMSPRAMAIATAAITAERVALGGARIARVIGAVMICAGISLMARAA
jgi:predicted metal-binding membrane protein